jgi:hypothetical protein
MPTPEHNPTTGHIGHPAAESAELETRQARDATIYDNATTPTRTTRTVSWLGWHVGELAGVTIPLVFGAAVWDGFYGASLLAALGWAANEMRLSRQRRTTGTRPAATPPETASTQDGEAE